MRSVIPELEQEGTLNEALVVVKNESFEMKRSLDRHDLTNGLRHAVQMIAELRTASLAPKFYYRLYIDVTNEVQHLLSYLVDNYLECEDHTSKLTVAEIYEYVQYTGNILPRLYLMITVSVVYLRSGENTARSVLFDLVEMCRGVQRPLRGLFLRNYLMSMVKEFIPDAPTRYPICGIYTENRSLRPEEETDVIDGIEIVLQNFAEMNKLWVRIQHLGPSKENLKRERERRELKILVGTNLVRLSQLKNLNLEIYQKVVLHRILEQSVSCKEPISQEYLMECIIQVFADRYHLYTLDQFLESCTMLHESVQIKNILATLIDHLTVYIASGDFAGLPDNVPDLFETFCRHTGEVTRSRVMAPEDVIAIQTALLNLALTCYKNNTSYPNNILASTAALFQKLEISSMNYESVIGREMTKLLKLPLEHFTDLDSFLKLDTYSKVLAALDFRGRAFISSLFIQTLIKHEAKLQTEEHIDKVFKIISSLLYDQTDRPQDGNDDEGLEFVAQLVHLIHNNDVERHFKLLSQARKAFGHGDKLRLGYTLPPTVFCLLKLIIRYVAQKDEMQDFNSKISKAFQFLMSTVSVLRVQAENPEMAVRFYLQAACLANKIPFDKVAEVTYELISTAITVYEEDISNSAEQVQAIILLMATIQQITCLTTESHEPLRNQCALHATKLIKRPDQVRCVCLAARMFWFSKEIGGVEDIRDDQRVAECLKKATKIAAQCMEETTQVKLYIEILTEYIFFYVNGCERIKPEMVNQLTDKIRDSIGNLEPSSEAEENRKTFKKLLKEIQQYKTNPPDSSNISFENFVL